MFSNKSVSAVLVLVLVTFAGCGPLGDVSSLLGGGSGSTSQSKVVKDFLEEQGIDTSSMGDETKLPADLTDEQKKAALDAANDAATTGFVNTPTRTNR